MDHESDVNIFLDESPLPWMTSLKSPFFLNIAFYVFFRKALKAYDKEN